MLNRPILTIGVISDTHLPYRLKTLPSAVTEIFSTVDLILHAGDVDQIEHLAPLKKIAPLYAVKGNFHLADLSFGGRNLPAEIRLTLAGRTIIVVHGHRPGVKGALLKLPDIVASAFVEHPNDKLNDQIIRRLSNRYPDADVVIFGHSHTAISRRVRHTLFFNPGAVAPTNEARASVGLLRFWATSVEPEIVFLADVNGTG